LFPRPKILACLKIFFLLKLLFHLGLKNKNSLLGENLSCEKFVSEEKLQFLTLTIFIHDTAAHNSGWKQRKRFK